jgi:hypothetical protein
MTAQKTMENKNKKKFPDLYEEVIDAIIIGCSVNKEKEEKKLLEDLKAKRKFGLEKYKENSFQFSFENSLECPTEQHLMEELLDSMNYISNIIYQRNLMNKNNVEMYKNMLIEIKKIYFFVKNGN